MQATSDLILEQHGNLLRQGAILVDPTDDGEEPHLLFLLTHEMTSGDGQVLSKRLQFVRVAPDGTSSFAGWAPHLDLDPLAPEDHPLLTDPLDSSQSGATGAGPRSSNAGARPCPRGDGAAHHSG
jgi:hypothetical protein